MTEAAAEVRSVAVERELPFSADRVWRALTEPHLVAEWLMAGDVRPVVGHGFSFGAEWGSVDCEVIEVDPGRSLAYSWNGMGLESTVTWTLTPTTTGTHLRMEQIGFRPDQVQAWHGARAGWPRFLAKLEELLGRID